MTASLRSYDRPSFFDSAACAASDVDPTWFFPTAEVDNGDLAIRVCTRCPVVSDCLTYASADPGLHGIWGGSRRGERVEIRKLGRNRLPFGPVDRVANVSTGLLAVWLGVDRRTIAAWRADGLPRSRAEKVATKLGRHVSELWPAA